MNTMKDQEIPRKPVVPSQLGAEGEFALWLRENRFEELRDGDGIVWKIDVRAKELPSPTDTHLLVWEVAIHASTRLSPEDLLRSKALDAVQDKRLIDLIEERDIPLHIKARQVSAASFQEARLKLAEGLSQLREELKAGSFTAVKRQLIGKWVDSQCLFGDRSDHL
jgi:hypothetical protein